MANENIEENLHQIPNAEPNAMGKYEIWEQNSEEISKCFDNVPSPPCHQPDLPITPAVDGVPLLEDFYPSPNRDVMISPIGPQSFSCFSPPHDIKDSESLQGVCGLKNLGNTCFMNAGLQCLLNNVHLINFFLNNDCLSADKDSLSGAFSNLMNKIWSGQYSVIYPSHLKELLGKRHPQFKDFRQHDCQEFLALLLDTFHEQLNTASADKDVCCSSKPSEDEHCLECEESSEIAHLSMESTHCSSANNEAKVNLSTVANKFSNPCSKSAGSSSVAENLYSGTNLSAQPTCSVRKVLPLKISSEKNQVGKYINNENTTESIVDSIHNIAHCSKNYTFVDHEKKIYKDYITKTEKNEIASKDNLSPNRYALLEDFVKDTKTLNTNVLINECINNELAFDSRKFPKFDRVSYRGAVDNLHSFPVNFTENSLKNFKLKETNLLANKELKGNKIGNLVECNPVCFKVESSLVNECSINSIKRMRLDGSSDNIMNCKKIKTGTNTMDDELEYANCSDDEEDVTIDSSDQSDEEIASCEPQQESEMFQSDQDLLDNMLAEKEWQKYLQQNKSVIVKTFLGQFKSTVVCAVCNHLSVTFEPFMYLPVPLPHAMERQFSIIYMSFECAKPTKYVVTVMRNLKVADLKKVMLSLTDDSNCEIVLAEVYGKHISKILDDSVMLQYVNDENRMLYAYKIAKLSLLEEPTNLESPFNSADAVEDLENISKWQSCAICLEEMMDTELLSHPSCGCVLCQSCIEISRKHYGGTSLICPVCIKEVKPEDEFIPLLYVPNQSNYFKKRVILTPISFRHDIESSSFDKELDESVTLFGHPLLLKLPTSLPASQLYDLIEKHCPIRKKFRILYVDGQGLRCSRCVYTAHCSGCELSITAEVTLHPGDNLSAAFYDVTNDQKQASSAIDNHSSVETLRKDKTITIYNCLEAFSESEKLDDLNPWFCPMCDKNQSAMKTLTVWKYPDTIMVYLKRFVFHNFVSTKLDNQVIFPIHEDLELGEFISGPGHFNNTDASNLYTLQACVSHFGGMNSGHYTGYSRHAVTGEWYYFNDESVIKKEPQDEDRRNAYILFYHKKGSGMINFPPKTNVPKEDQSVGCSLMEITSLQSMNPDAVDKVLMVLENDEKEEQKNK